MAIIYTDSLESLEADDLTGFFVGWPQHPDPVAHLRILRGSHKVWLALDGRRCDETLQEFYERLGFDSKLGMVIRNRKNATAQSEK